MKKGSLVTTYERISQQIAQDNRQDSEAAGASVVTTLNSDGKLQHSFSEPECGVTGNGLQFFLVMTLFRHILICAGLATEHSFHTFHMWFLNRIQVGMELRIVERCCKALLGKIDRGDASWTTVINLFGVDQMDLLQKRSVAPSPARATSPASLLSAGRCAARDPLKSMNYTAGGIALSAICRLYNTHNTATPGHSSCSSSALCGKQHCCNAQLPKGSLCGGRHPSWDHMSHQLQSAPGGVQ